jgi:sterol desaturase/sphingolipid hydroxylase (fatty acid hydroxylase superfamily)
MPQINTNIILNAIPAFIILAILESLVLTREHRNPETQKNVMASLGLGLVFIVCSFFSKGFLLFVYSWLYNFRVFHFGQYTWWIWVLCFLGEDFSYYWYHRACHSIRFLWATHLVHHSSETYNFIASFRQSWFGNVNGSFIFWIWMPLAGFTPEMILYAKSISTIYQFFIHTETVRKLPRWIEYIFNTPSHHRVHHSSDLEYLDKNHGGSLIIFDRLFGTFKEESFAPHYGLTKKLNSYNPVYITFSEWISIVKDLRTVKSLKNLFLCFFGSPGWRPPEIATTDLQKIVSPANTLHKTVMLNSPEQRARANTLKYKTVDGFLRSAIVERVGAVR